MKLKIDLVTLIPSFYLPVVYTLFIYSTQVVEILSTP